MRQSRKALGIALFLATSQALGAGADPGELRVLLHTFSAGSRPEINQAIERVTFLGRPREIMNALERMTLEGGVGERRNATFALGFLASPAHAKALVKALEDEDVIVRGQACTALGKLRAKAAVEPLVGLTRDSSPVVRREAVRALGSIGDKRGVPAALGLIGDSVPETSLAAIVALGQIKDARAVPKLLPLLEQDSETARLAAARSLCVLGRPEGRAVAESLLGSAQPTERRDGVRVVEGLKTPWASSALARLLGDHDRGVQIAAAVALARAGDGRGPQWLAVTAEGAEPEARLQFETAIEQIGLTPADRKKILAASKTSR